jgi:hypothetical protein
MKKLLLVLTVIMTIMIVSFSCKKDKGSNDTTAPVITMNPPNPYTVAKDSVYVDPGATATDETDGDISSKITSTNNINIAVIGTYQVRYNVADNAGNAATEAVRTVNVVIMK